MGLFSFLSLNQFFPSFRIWPLDSFFSYLFEVVPSRRVDTRVASSRQPSFALFQDDLQKGHLTPFFIVTSFHRFDFLTGHWLTFSFPRKLMSGIIIFILVPKQPLFCTLVLLDSREETLGMPRSFLDLRFNQHSYPFFLGILGCYLGEAMPHHQFAQH